MTSTAFTPSPQHAGNTDPEQEGGTTIFLPLIRASMNIAAPRRKVAIFVASQWDKTPPLAFRS
jgi:hypothetical protein